jgi:uncharacterized protein (TIGR02996 family)
MNPKARGFLEDIASNPDDDTPRLVFADWLEDEGDEERAEFIRVQIERSRLPAWDVRQVRLRIREAELLARHGKKWKGDLPELKGITWEGFRRGFVATAKVASFAVLRDKASECWAAAPIEEVTIRWPRKVENVKGIPVIPGLRELSINSTLVESRAVGLLAEAPLLSPLRALNIRDGNLGVEGFRRLAASPHLGNLKALRLPSNDIGNGGIEVLFEAASLGSLEELDLAQTESYGRYNEDPIIAASGMKELAGWPGLARLRSLTLSGNDLGQIGLRALLRSSDLSSLKELDLRASNLDGEAMEEFIRANPNLQLDVLDLSYNLLEDMGAAGLANAPCLRELKVLKLTMCEMPADGAQRLALGDFIASLRHLNADHNNFGPEGLHALLEKKPSQLHTLSLVNNDLGDEGALHLAESPASATLLAVDLRQNGLRVDATEALAASKHLGSLLVLRLNDNPIAREAAANLRQSPLGNRIAILEAPGEDVLPF